MLMSGLTCYNPKNSVPSDLSPDNLFLPTDNTATQGSLDIISQWTDDNEMRLNTEKTRYMILNFCKSLRFGTRLHLNGSLLDQARETKLLGVIISDDLTWHSNTRYITTRAYQRMIILKNLYQFNIPVAELVTIYTMYIRSILEQSCVVWGSSITQDEVMSIERVQKCALRIILKSDYMSYENGLAIAKLSTIQDRIRMLQLRFAKKCVSKEATQDMFPLKLANRTTRQTDIYEVPFARTSRLARSAIPTMARLLNEDLKTN